MSSQLPAVVELHRIAQVIEGEQRLTPSHEIAVQLIHAAQRALDQASTIDQVKDIRDKVRAFEVWFKRQRAELTDGNLIASQRLRTERRLGAYIAETPREKGGRPNVNSSTELTSFQQLLNRLGISRETSSRWQALAELEEQDFETWIADQISHEQEVTTAGALQYWNEHIAKNRNRERVTEPITRVPKSAPNPPDNFSDDNDFSNPYEDLLVECDQAFENIMSMTADRDIISICTQQHGKIVAAFKESVNV